MSFSRGRAVRAVVRKDLRVALSSKAVSVPFVVVPLLLTVVFPLVVALVAPLAASQPELLDQLGRLAPALEARLAGLDAPQQVVVLGLEYVFAPLFLVVPLMVASVLARERGELPPPR